MLLKLQRSLIFFLQQNYWEAQNQAINQKCGPAEQLQELNDETRVL